MKAARVLGGTLLAALSLAGISALSRVPLTPPGADAAVLRLSWRVRGEHLETCRKRTQAELDALPVHMRAPEVCERRLASYRLVVGLDGQAPDTQEVLPGGARGDRPVFVFREIELAPGTHQLRISFRSEHQGPGALDLEYAETVHASPGEIDLITLDPGAGRLVHADPRMR